MTRYWQMFSDRFNALARREQVILLLAVLAVIYLIWSLLFLMPNGARLDQLRAQKQTLESRFLDLEAQEHILTQATGRDPLAAKKRQVEVLREQLRALDQQLQALSVGLVPADMLPQVLHDVLSSAGNLELLGMQTLPVQKLSLTSDNSIETGDAAGVGTQQVEVYRHSVELKVRGSYFAVSQYLRALEKLQWRFYWDRLNYQVDAYPNGIATLEVYTLSAGQGVLGE